MKFTAAVENSTLAEIACALTIWVARGAQPFQAQLQKWQNTEL